MSSLNSILGASNNFMRVSLNKYSLSRLLNRHSNSSNLPCGKYIIAKYLVIRHLYLYQAPFVHFLLETLSEYNP